MNIRDIVKKGLTPQNKQKLQSVILNTERILCGRKKVETTFWWEAIGEASNNCFFGYYDVSPFNSKGEVLYLKLDKELREADIMLYNRNSNQHKLLSTSRAWNWQQGSRLRWFPKTDDTIVFNDCMEGRYIARKINTSSQEEEIYNSPLYDIDCNGKLGLSLDFGRLGLKRPGYGYTYIPYKEPDDLSNDGIDLINLIDNTSKRIVTYNDIADIIKINKKNYSNNYINHLSFSPSGNKFMFFWLTVVGGYHKAYMLVYDLQTQSIMPLETEMKVSHYLWLDENHLLCTVYNEKEECSYVIYGLDGSKRHVFKSINFDGHPIWYKGGLILTDSYPIKKGYQQLLKCNLETDKVEKILEVFHEPAISIERRTDLHPRYDEATDTICIDACPKGKRNLYLIKE